MEVKMLCYRPIPYFFLSRKFTISNPDSIINAVNFHPPPPLRYKYCTTPPPSPGLKIERATYRQTSQRRHFLHELNIRI